MPRAVKHTLVAIVVMGVIASGLGEWAVRHELQQRYEIAVQTQRHLAFQIAQVRRERDQFSDALLIRNQYIKELSESLVGKDEQLQEAIIRLTEEERTIQELQEKLLAIQRQFDMLQGELALTIHERTSPTALLPSPFIQLEKVVVAQPVKVEPDLQGRVLSVDPEWKFVVIDLGWNAVRIGDVVSIYREHQLLGKARVERVQEQVSAATLLPEWNEVDVQVNDIVRPL